MIESFVINKINQERQIFEDLWSSLRVDEKLTVEIIAKSPLSEFTKNYILNVVDETGDRDEILDRIAKANKLRFNYAIRPKWTLITYLFGNYESRPPTEISKKLQLFPFYNFYVDSINDVLRDNFSIFITRNEVSMLIDETNKAIYRKLTTDINNAKIKNFFLQIYSLKYNEQELNLESTIPYSFIKLFLNDKYYFDIEKKFQLVRGISDEYEISLKDVIKVLMNKYDFDEKESEANRSIAAGTDTSVHSADIKEPSLASEILKPKSSIDKTRVVVSDKIEAENSEQQQKEQIDINLPAGKKEDKISEIPESKPEPVTESKPEPIPESKPEPVAESKNEPAKVKGPEPVIGSKPEHIVAGDSGSDEDGIPEAIPEKRFAASDERKAESETRTEDNSERSAKSKTGEKSKSVIRFRREPKLPRKSADIPVPAVQTRKESPPDKVQTPVVSKSEAPVEEPRSVPEAASTIKKLFSDKQFDRILERVYKSDFEYTARSFMKLSNYKTWFEASNHLKEVFKANDVDIYNKDVISFVDTLNDYFSERG